ncbi:MAG: NrfD/PsrC family molybdoenzyme membrane anchor subunit [Solirubrobacterales bacterium]
MSGDVHDSVSGGETYVHGDRGKPRPREERMVPREKPVSYYGRPIVKPPVWKPEIPFYFFFGGLAGASAVLASAATFAGRPELARRAWVGAFVGVTVSPLLLIKDLGKPMRFLHMLRVFKITSPMNVGAWILLANGGATSLAAGLNLLDEDRRGGAPEVVAAVLGAPLATYTAALVTHSAIPAWSEARAEMPFVFAASATASAAGAAMLSVPADEAEPARRLGIAAAIAEEAITVLMHKRLGPLADSYKKGTAGKFGKAARALTTAGALAFLAGDDAFHPPHQRSSLERLFRPRPERRRAKLRNALSMTGGALLLAGSVCKRWSVFKAGFQSAEDPSQVVRTQREGIDRSAG